MEKISMQRIFLIIFCLQADQPFYLPLSPSDDGGKIHVICDGRFGLRSSICQKSVKVLNSGNKSATLRSKESTYSRVDAPVR